MAEQDQDQKTEEPTQKRLDEAREEGQLPISREMATWWLFISILLVIAWVVPDMGGKLVGSLRPFIEMPHAISLEGNGIQYALANVVGKAGLATIVVFCLLGASVIIGTMVQTGFYFNPANIKFHPDRLNPWAGIKRLFSSQAVAELVKSFMKLVVVGFMAFFVLWPLFNKMPVLVGTDLVRILGFLHRQVIYLIVIIMLVVTVIAVADLIYQRMRYFKNLRMTKQEVRDEYKQMEGDPMVKSRLRAIRLERARRRMMASVPKADVVVTNPTHYAVALQYDPKGMAAPKVVAKGINLIANRIREVAEANDVPLVSNPPLARALYDTVEVDDIIAPEHYRAVAEVISFVYKLKKKKI